MNDLDDIEEDVLSIQKQTYDTMIEQIFDLGIPTAHEYSLMEHYKQTISTTEKYKNIMNDIDSFKPQTADESERKNILMNILNGNVKVDTIISEIESRVRVHPNPSRHAWTRK